MRRFLICWLLATQLPAMLALWTAKEMALVAAATSAPGLDANWALIAWGGFGIYLTLILGLSGASWFYFKRGEDNVSVIISSLLLPVILPILVYTVVRFFALR